MNSGIRPNEYWDMSLSEISGYITAKRQSADCDRKRRNRMDCIIAYKTAELIALGINCPKKFPQSVNDAFPGVFDDQPLSVGIPVADWKRSKEHMQEYKRLRQHKGRMKK